MAPLIDPDHVDERRAKVGLGSIASCVAYFGFVWYVEKHKTRTAKIEAEKNEK